MWVLSLYQALGSKSSDMAAVLATRKGAGSVAKRCTGYQQYVYERAKACFEIGGSDDYVEAPQSSRQDLFDFARGEFEQHRHVTDLVSPWRRKYCIFGQLLTGE